MSKRNRNNNSRRRGNSFPTSNRRLFGETFLPRSPLKLYEFEDRRLFHPDPVAPARSFNTTRHRLVIKNVPTHSKNYGSPSAFNRSVLQSSLGPLPNRVAFQAPKRVLICVRRKQRKEVIHALGKSGSGVRRKKPRRSTYSDVSC